jgi:HD superfamily phosphohydrolase
LPKRNLVPDPIVGTIELPPWVVAIKNEPAIRRMILIRQLGLKAYIDYPGAIHTRYSHSLGTFFLSGRLVDALMQKMHDCGAHVIERNLNDNRNNIMAAGFLHDIAHGPFSHCVDFAMEMITGKKHQELAEDIINNCIVDY